MPHIFVHATRRLKANRDVARSSPAEFAAAASTEYATREEPSRGAQHASVFAALRAPASTFSCFIAFSPSNADDCRLRYARDWSTDDSTDTLCQRRRMRLMPAFSRREDAYAAAPAPRGWQSLPADAATRGCRRRRAAYSEKISVPTTRPSMMPPTTRIWRGSAGYIRALCQST
jgi:hypothetical protein